MYFYEQIKKIEGAKSIYVDMDGVIAMYEVGKAYGFDKKRPLMSNIKVLEEISKLPNTKMHILSICIKDSQIKEKNDWLDKNASFFKKENRHILSKETYKSITSGDLKLNYLKNNLKDTTILIDDDNSILLYIRSTLKEKVILFQDSSLID